MDIKRLALFLRTMAWIGAVLVLARPFLGWFGPVGQFATIADVHLAEALSGPAPARYLVMALLLLPYLSIAWGMALLAGFCTQLAREQHFTPAAARTLARLGWAIVTAALLLPATRLLALMWIDDTSPARILAMALRVPTLISITMGLIFGIIIIIFSALLEKSVKLHDENSSFL